MKRLLSLFAVALLLTNSTVFAAGVKKEAAAVGDAKNGEALYTARCTGCHSIDASRAGPSHRGVYGRKAGKVADFTYSDAVKKSKIVWNDKSLNKWLENPEKFIPGQKMGFSVPESKDRGDLIAYLKTQK